MDRGKWNSIISGFGNTTILQTWEWAELKRETGWTPDYYVRQTADGKITAASLILRREHALTRFGPKVRVLYLPHGPLVDWANETLVQQVLEELTSYARSQNAIYVKIDPQVKSVEANSLQHANPEIINENLMDWMKEKGWRYSSQQIQFKNTFWINLSPSEDELLAAMKQKTRYNIRLSGRKGIRVREGGLADLELLYEMYLETSTRDRFIIRPKDYYLRVWGDFIRADLAIPLIARYESEPVAALILFHFAKKSYYLYGMSTDNHREKMPNYLLQWEAIRRSKEIGCEIYDLWGAPDVFEKSDPMWGVYRFKEGLGAEVIQTIGAFDYPINQFNYTIIQSLLPVAQKLTRRMRMKEMRDELDQT